MGCSVQKLVKTRRRAKPQGLAVISRVGQALSPVTEGLSRAATTRLSRLSRRTKHEKHVGGIHKGGDRVYRFLDFSFHVRDVANPAHGDLWNRKPIKPQPLTSECICIRSTMRMWSSTVDPGITTAGSLAKCIHSPAASASRLAIPRLAPRGRNT